MLLRHIGVLADALQAGKFLLVCIDPEPQQAGAAMQISPDKARELAQRGASILLLDVPEGTRVGLDHQVGAAPCCWCAAYVQ